MLILTPAATAAVSALLHSPGVPEGSGLRLQRSLGPAGEQTIGVEIVPAPQSDDARVPGGDSEVFLAPEVADLLDDQVLDAEFQSRGVAFMLMPQSTNGAQLD